MVDNKLLIKEEKIKKIYMKEISWRKKKKGNIYIDKKQKKD